MDNEEFEELEDIPYADGTLGGVIADPASNSDDTYIAYKSIYEPQVPFKTLTRKVFIPNIPLVVRISKYERNVTKHLLNPYLYTIELNHGPFSWTINKRYKHFMYLHQQLKLFRTGLMIPFPTDAHKKNRESFKVAADKTSNPKAELPRLPLKPEILIGFDEVDQRCQELEKYLQNLVNILPYRSHPETVQFFSASHLSFVSDLGVKSVEGLVKKQTGSTHKGCCCGLLECGACLRLGHLLSDTCGCWRERWLVVKDTWIGYVRARDSALRGVILFDHGFEVSASLYSSAIQVYNLQRRIVFKCRGRRKRADWCQTIKNIAARQGFGFTQRNPYSSFAPTRSDTGACWFVDGASYMEAAADAIHQAKEEIFIADWWLSPEIYLKRPSLEGHVWRLDTLLKQKADEGVQIFVLLYKEVEMALGINSYYSKSRLSKLHHQNIKVLRHPNHTHSGVFLWAHHEKIICVDQTYAFLGGIDLCYGRWDDGEHRLVDFGSSGVPVQGAGDGVCKRKITSSRPLGSGNRPVATLMQNSKNIGRHVVAYNGGAEEATEITDIEEGTEIIMSAENSEIQPSAENVKGGSPELERRSILGKLQRTSKLFLSQLTGDVSREQEQQETSEDMAEVSEEPVESKIAFENFNAAADATDGLVGSCKYWLGKDYCNFIVKDFSNLESPYQDIVDRNTTPRMPWHDVGVMVHGAAARDVARHFIQRWNITKLEKAKNISRFPYLVPKSYENFEGALPPRNSTVFRVNCQVLRSVSSWSAGFQDPEVWEESIHEAYITSISKAKHYIYIENQFFISLAKQNPDVKNQVAEAICKRILRAHKEEAVFRVYVVLPLLPGFEGEVGGPSGTALHAITHWNYASICRGKGSILMRLKEQGIDHPQEYVSFHGLRTHSAMHGDLVTELIYVHSKLMIIDDEIVICGSANINDRSLIGRRDSEIAVIIKDEELIESTMNNQPAMVGLYASTLRKQLFAEHLGDPNLALADPVVDTFYHDVWRVTSQTNTDLFEKVFHCLPSDSVTSFRTLQTYHDEVPMAVSDPCEAASVVSEIKGHLVNMPLHFLEEEILTPDPKSVEGLMPTALWT